MAVKVLEVTIPVRSPTAIEVQYAGNDCTRFVLSAAKALYENTVFY